VQDVEDTHCSVWLQPLDSPDNVLTLQGDTTGALSHAHFKAEGDVEFRSILYIPSTAPWDFYDSYYSRKPAIKLYVRRVFISEEFEDLLPKYLSFLIGLVDSDTLPLNVSREMLQQHSSLRTIKKKLVRTHTQ
jgi:heat shock protein 90kDa beta